MLVFVIKEIREKKKISLRKLSQQTGISRAYLYDLENNRRFNPTIQILCTISSCLDVNVKDLFYTELDIEKLKKKLNIYIEKYGLHSKEVTEISQIIDLLINIKMSL